MESRNPSDVDRDSGGCGKNPTTTGIVRVRPQSRTDIVNLSIYEIAVIDFLISYNSSQQPIMPGMVTGGPAIIPALAPATSSVPAPVLTCAVSTGIISICAKCTRTCVS